MRKKLFLIDAYALIYRFHYAFVTSPMRNPSGQNVSAVFGFVKFLYELLDRESPEYLGVAFDPKGGNFRHKIFDGYKANREATPEDIVLATPIIKEILRAMCIPILEVEGYEADDVIGTLSLKASQSGIFDTYMVTPDKDYGQLVNYCTFMYKPAKGGAGIEVWGENEICQQFSIETPNQVIDILAISGDAADNIPGVAGIGEKGAAKLLKEFHSVEGILQNIQYIKGKTKEKIELSAEKMKLSKVLATICREVPIEFDVENLRICNPDVSTLRALYREHNFRYFLQRLESEQIHIGIENCSSQRVQTTSYSEQKRVEASQGSLFDNPSIINNTPPTNATPNRGDFTDITDYKTILNREHNYTKIDSVEALQSLVQRITDNKIFAFDTETTSLDTLQAELVGISISLKSSEAYWIPTNTDTVKKYLEILRIVFESENIIKVGQNLKYDIGVLSNYGIEVNGELRDTMLMHYILDAEGRHSMDMMARNFMGYQPIAIEELIGRGSKQLLMSQVPATQILEYAAEDADITLSLHDIFRPQLEERGAVELYSKVEEPLIKVLSDMEREGVKIDTTILDQAAIKLNGRLSEIDSSIRELSNCSTININSPKQLGELLFENLKLNDKAKKTKTGQYKTDEATLESLKDKHPVVEQILEYRGIKKLLSTYVEALPELINSKSGRVHTSFNQAATATGRLSSSNPNLQNIPIREAMGRDIRRAFVARNDNWSIVAADYSQIELRIMAHLSGDEALCEAFIHNEDIHTATASKIFMVEAQEVTSEQRRRAKTANFGIIYGISTFGLASRLSIPRGEAKELIDGYFGLYGGVKSYMDEAISKAKNQGYVETIFGRRRYLSDINSSNGTVRGLAERNAINAPIQGSAADIMKLAMVGIHSELRRRGLQSRMVLQIHDEIVIETLNSEIEEIKSIIQEQMEGVVDLKVPLTVDIGVGKNWLEAH